MNLLPKPMAAHNRACRQPPRVGWVFFFVERPRKARSVWTKGGANSGSKALQGTGDGNPLNAEKAAGFVSQLKLQAQAASRALTIGVQAALAGSVLRELPEQLPDGAATIPEIIDGIDWLSSSTFQ